MEHGADWARRHPVAVDASRAVGLFVLSGAGRFAHPSSGRLLMNVLLCAPLVFRRRVPRVVFVMIAAFALVQFVVGSNPDLADAAVLLALYTVVEYEPRRDAVVATGIVALGVVMAAFRWSSHRPWQSMLVLSLVTTATVLIGETMRVRRGYLAELEARADRLERERDQQAEIAVAGERARIARELHDIVAHSVSVMVAQADGARYAIASHPDQSHDAMEVIARTGREALAEMRHLLGVLRPRETTGETEPQPRIEHVDDLIQCLRDTGLDIRLHVDGAARALPAGPALAAYRVVQEALTNAFRHAGRETRAAVWIAYRPDGGYGVHAHLPIVTT